MHDGHPHGSCGDCVSFVPIFDRDGPGDWGYCGAYQNPPMAQVGALRRAYLDGDRRALRENGLGIFRTEPDDCCDLFRARAG